MTEQKNPLALQNEGNLKLSEHASHPLFSAEVAGNPEAGVLTPPNLFRVTVGGTAPDSHRLAYQLSPRSRSGTSGFTILFYAIYHTPPRRKGQYQSALTPPSHLVIICWGLPIFWGLLCII